MPAWLVFIFEIILMTIVVFFAYSLLRQYVFSRIKVNKWVIICIAVVAFLIPLVLQVIGVKLTSTLIYIQSGIYVIIFLWLFDTLGWGRRPVQTKNTNIKNANSKKDNIVIRSKAKPNRLKNTDMEVIDISDAKSRKKKK